MNFQEFCNSLDIKPGRNFLIHAGFRKIRTAFPSISLIEVINSLKNLITESGSIIFPSFTYCFKKSKGNFEIYDRVNSPGKVGIISEAFRKLPGVIRTSSPTHSFLMWGRIKNYIDYKNAPVSPLGKGSVLEWLAGQEDSYILTLGTDFSSVSFCHYLESIAPVPWLNYAPWNYLNILNIGVSKADEQELIEVPGCSKSFTNFEKYLLQKRVLQPLQYHSLYSYLIPVGILLDQGVKFFKEKYASLLCSPGTCKFCDARREKFL